MTTELSVSPTPLLLPPDFHNNVNVTVGWSGLLFALFGVLHFTGCALPVKHQLSERDRGEWNVRIVSTVNAVACSLGKRAQASDSDFSREIRVSVYSGMGRHLQVFGSEVCALSLSHCQRVRAQGV